jgi:hypothetical protein
MRNGIGKCERRHRICETGLVNAKGGSHMRNRIGKYEGRHHFSRLKAPDATKIKGLAVRKCLATMSLESIICTAIRPLSPDAIPCPGIPALEG